MDVRHIGRHHADPCLTIDPCADDGRWRDFPRANGPQARGAWPPCHAVCEHGTGLVDEVKQENDVFGEGDRAATLRGHASRRAGVPSVGALEPSAAIMCCSRPSGTTWTARLTCGLETVAYSLPGVHVQGIRVATQARRRSLSVARSAEADLHHARRHSRLATLHASGEGTRQGARTTATLTGPNGPPEWRLLAEQAEEIRPARLLPSLAPGARVERRRSALTPAFRGIPMTTTVDPTLSGVHGDRHLGKSGTGAGQAGCPRPY